MLSDLSMELSFSIIMKLILDEGVEKESIVID